MDKKKTRRTAMVTAFCGLLLFGFPAFVYAGEINAAEQRVIDYYNRVFYYDGKNYVATDAAKASVYAKMAADGVDLTEREVDSAIRQASRSVAAGIEQGILVEVSANGDSGAGAETGGEGNGEAAGGEEDGEAAGGEEDGEATSEEGNSGEETTGTDEDADSGKTDAGNVNGTGTGGTGSSGDGAGSDGTGSSGDGAEFDDSLRKTDIVQMLEEAAQEGEEYNRMELSEDFTVTMERYAQGKVLAVSNSGYILFEGGLPLKNTGYNTGKFQMTAFLVLSGLCSTIAAAIVWICRMQRPE